MMSADWRNVFVVYSTENAIVLPRFCRGVDTSSILWVVTQRMLVHLTDVSGQPFGFIFKGKVYSGLLDP